MALTSSQLVRMQNCGARHCNINGFKWGTPKPHCNVGAVSESRSFLRGLVTSARICRRVGQRSGRYRGPDRIQSFCHSLVDGADGESAHVLHHFPKQRVCIQNQGDRRIERGCTCITRTRAAEIRGGAASSDHTLSNSLLLGRAVAAKAVTYKDTNSTVEPVLNPISTSAKSERRDRWRPSFAWLLALSLLLGDASALAPAAQAFPFFGPSQEKDPVEPFVIYGTVEKKFLIEKIEDGRIVGRKKGFTASVCAKCVGANAETPEFLGLPTGMKMEEAPGEQSCSKWEAASKDEVCAKPCKLSCDDAVARQVRLERASTGYELDPGDRQKALRGCAAACENECQKPGRSSAFVVPIRP